MGRRRKKFKNGLMGFRLKLRKSTIFSVLSLGFAILGVITIFSFLKEGLILRKLNVLFWDLFGFVSFGLPFIFFLIAILFSKFKTVLREPNVVVGAVILFISFLGFARSGTVGFWLWDQVAFLITEAGAFLIFGGGVLIGLVVFLNTSLERILKFILVVLKIIQKYTFDIKLKREKRKPIFISEEGEKSFSHSTAGSKPVVSDSKQESSLVIPSNVFHSHSGSWQYPPLDLLSDVIGGEADRGNVNKNAETIEKTLDSFGITAKVVEVNKGPSVTQYGLEVSLGTKLSKITALSNDLALALAAPTGQIRIEAPIPGRSLVGIEVPNKSGEIVSIKKMLISDQMRKMLSKLTVPLGLDVSGNPRVADICNMPHVLVAGQTGSGKSVLLNSWIATLLFRTTPDEVRLILIDPKRVELTRYNDVPHLLAPVVVEREKVIQVLGWAMKEMDRRYQIFSEKGARNIEVFNEMAEPKDKLPYLVIIIDELAEIMLQSPTEVEDKICRIAQMARATGIHLVLATQRPSVDVLTGLIKANIPCRISFAVASLTDSRVILDNPGAERLLGKGDMLYIPPDQAKPTRIQGAFISDVEVNNLIDFLKKQGQVEYQEEVFNQPVVLSKGTVLVNGQERDPLFEEAARIVRLARKASSSLLQRKLKIGYARAARILDELESAGVVGPADGSKCRQVIG